MCDRNELLGEYCISPECRQGAFMNILDKKDGHDIVIFYDSSLSKRWLGREECLYEDGSKKAYRAIFNSAKEIVVEGKPVTSIEDKNTLAKKIKESVGKQPWLRE